MAGVIHEIAVGRVLTDFPQAKTKGFRAAIRRTFPEAVEIGNFERLPGIIPDAYWIDTEKSTVVAFEVEAGNPVDDAKMAAYADIWWMLDEEAWSLALILVDRWGVQTAILDMGNFAINKLVEDAKRSGRKPLPETVRFVEQLRRLNPELATKKGPLPVQVWSR